MPRLTACSTLAFSLSSLETALKHIRDYEFRHVEIAEMLTHSKHFPVDTVDPVAVKDLLAKYELTPIAGNICIASLKSGPSDYVKLPVEKQSASETEEIRTAKQDRVFYRLHVEAEATEYTARVRKVIENAAIAGIPAVGLQAGRRGQIEDLDREIEAAAKVIDEQAEYARSAGIRILMEMPHVWDLYYDVERSKQMLSSLRSDNIGVTIDSTHWHTSDYDLDDYVSHLKDRLWHVHLRDAAGKDSPTGNYELEKTPGKGEVDFRRLGETLDRHGYEGTVTLETEYKNYKDPTEVDEENTFAISHLESEGWDMSESLAPSAER